MPQPLAPLRPSSLGPIFSSLSLSLTQRSKPSHTLRHVVPSIAIQRPAWYSTKRTRSPNLPDSKSTAKSKAPRTADRGPASKETTQTDFGALDVLASMPPPTTAIDATHPDGFSLNSGIEVAGAGVLLYGGEAFKWRPWVRDGSEQDDNDATPPAPSPRRSLRDATGLLWECGRRAWGVLDVAWPKPDLLIIGTGATIVPISPTTRRHINDLGIRLEVADTRNAASQFNLLATERGVNQVAAALVPVGWKEEVKARVGGKTR